MSGEVKGSWKNIDIILKFKLHFLAFHCDVWVKTQT